MENKAAKVAPVQSSQTGATPKQFADKQQQAILMANALQTVKSK